MQLNFPEYDFKVKTDVRGKQIFDSVRRKYVLLTPEEWVRQHVLMHLSTTLGYPPGLLSVEKAIELNGMTKRYDVVAYGKNGKPLMVIECKAPEIKITQETFNQIARYNLVLKVNYLLVTNGIEHFVCRIHPENQEIEFLSGIPNYADLQVVI